MSQEKTTASIKKTAFSCPHCGAYSSQSWYRLKALLLDGENKKPTFPITNLKEELEKDQHKIDPAVKINLILWGEKINTGEIFKEKETRTTVAFDSLHNLHVSECFSCNKFSIWVHKSLVYPAAKEGCNPNLDLPPDITRDFEEARSIINISPRGAAALLRLCIQKLCIALGEKGKNIDDDIASLVTKGLSPLVQKSLDIVRVIGNEAVHPGSLDLRDDRDTALQLLGIVNVIAEQMLTLPKTINEMYDNLPDAKKLAIEKRNERALK